jgi:hypothetical protein
LTRFHTNPKRQRGKRLSPSLALRVSVSVAAVSRIILIPSPCCEGVDWEATAWRMRSASSIILLLQSRCPPQFGAKNMRKWVLASVCPVLIACGLVLAAARPARAVKQFRDEFKAKYVKTDSREPKAVSLREAVEQARCNVCHVGDDKEHRNAYGKALAKLLNRKTDAKNKEKIRQALERVAGMKSDPNNPKSPTFGELIRQGRLPAGEK